MGHSECDPGFAEWRLERWAEIGAKRALKRQQVWAIRSGWIKEGRRRDRAISLSSYREQAARIRGGQVGNDDRS